MDTIQNQLHGGRYRGSKLPIYFNCNAYQICPWVVTSKKVIYMKFTWHSFSRYMLNNKRSLTFCRGVQVGPISTKLHGLKLIRLSCIWKMYSFIYLRCPNFGQKGVKVQWSQRGTMVTDLWPLDSHTSWRPRYAKLYLFWIIWVNQLIWAQFHWNRTNLKNWPCTWPFIISTSIWRTKHCMNFLKFHGLPVTPRKIYNLKFTTHIEACWLF